MDPDDINPDWQRPPDWKFKSDWNSPNWRRQMDAIFARAAERANKYGFSKCPECGTQHTRNTLCCRECEYRIRHSFYAGVPILDFW